MASTQNLYQCRLCLKRTPTRVNIFGGDFPKMLEILTSIKVYENDGLPKYSCIQCALDVDTGVTIKKRIIKSHKYLEERLQNPHKPDEANKKLAVESQTHEKPVIKYPKIVISHEPDRTAAFKAAELSINKKLLRFSSQNLSKDITPKVEVKLEAQEESQNENSDDKVSSTSTNKIRNKAKIRTTNDEGNYTCKVCNTSFSKKSAYKVHCAKHRKTKCGICHKTIRSDNIKQHLNVHFSGPSVCNLCGQTCKNAVSLRTHIFYQHRNLDAYVCEAWGTKFNSRYRYLLHQAKVHPGVRKFKCETCGKEFFTKHHLSRHDNITHKKLRPHICEFCGTGFCSRKALKSHNRRHTGEKPYACDYCDDSFRQRVSLRSHLKSKHGIEEAKESICLECGRAFVTDFALSVHERLHKSIKCELCSESFADQEYLDNHLKIAHGGQDDSQERQTTEEICEELYLKVEDL